MTERAKLEAPAPADAFWTPLTHLQLVPCPELYAKLADLQVEHTYKLLPCHSSALAAQSKVLSTMFDDMSKEEWASGVTAALAGHSLKDVEIYLTLVHSPGIDIDRTRMQLKVTYDMLGVAKLAHKLDSPLVLEKIDSYLSANIGIYKWVNKRDTRSVPLFWLPTLETLDMPKTKDACIIRVVDVFLKGAHGVSDRDKMEIANLPGCNKELLEALSPEMLRALLQGVLRARSQDSKAQPWKGRPLEFWENVVKFVIWVVIGASPMGFSVLLLLALFDPGDLGILPSRVYLPLKGKFIDHLFFPVFSISSISICWAFLGFFWVCIFIALLYCCYVCYLLLNLPGILDETDKQWKITR